MVFGILLAGIVGGTIGNVIGGLSGQITLDSGAVKLVIAYKDPEGRLDIVQIGHDDFYSFFNKILELTESDINIIFGIHYGVWQTKKVGFHLKAYFPDYNQFNKISAKLYPDERRYYRPPSRQEDIDRYFGPNRSSERPKIINKSKGGDDVYDVKKFPGLQTSISTMKKSEYLLYDEYFKYFEKHKDSFINNDNMWISTKYHSIYMIENVPYDQLYDELVRIHQIVKVQFDELDHKAVTPQDKVIVDEIVKYKDNNTYAFYFKDVTSKYDDRTVMNNRKYNICLKFHEELYPLLRHTSYFISNNELQNIFAYDGDRNKRPIGSYFYGFEE